MTRKMQVILGIVTVLALLGGWQWWSHSGEEANSAIRTEGSAAEPVAAVVHVEQRSLGIPLALAGAFKPFQDVDVHDHEPSYYMSSITEMASTMSDSLEIC